MKTKFFALIALAISTIVFFSCSDDDEPNTMIGQLDVKVTDAPSDDANIEGAFITISEIKVDGETVQGFEKQTIDISAYQNGETKLIFSDIIEAGNYNSVSIKLDYESDASGESPGCYVLTSDDQKHDLAASSSASLELSFNKNFEVQSNENSTLVFDFDLRKTIKRNENDTETDYSFVSEAEINSGIRVVNENATGEIEGDVTINTIAEDQEYIVYAYKKGEYNAETETQGDAGSNLLFTGAVTSSKVKQDGSYKLSFLEEGDYEIHVANYSRTNTENELSFTVMANAVSDINNIVLNNVSVSSNTTIELDLSINSLF